MDSNRRRSAVVFAVVGIAALIAIAVAVKMGSDVKAPVPVRSTFPEVGVVARAPKPTPSPVDAVAIPAATPMPAERVDEVRLFGRVTDADGGAPIPDAGILLFDLRSRTPGTDRTTIATSDADGRFETFVERRVSRAVLAAQARGYTRMAGTYVAPAMQGEEVREREIDFALQAGGGTITGNVVDEQAAPVAGAVVGGVRLRPVDAKQSDLDAWNSVTETDAEGRFVLDGLPEGRSFAFTASAPGFITGMSGETAVGGETTIVLERSEASVSGIVTTHDGHPVSDVQVVLRPADGKERTRAEELGRSGATETDANGAFSFPDLHAGRFFVTASMWRDGCEAGSDACVEFDLAPGEAREVTLRLPAPIVLTGRMYEVATGNGVGGVGLSNRGIDEYRARSARRGSGTTTRSEPDGTYRLEVIPRADGSGEVKVDLPEGWVALKSMVGDAFFVQKIAEQKEPTYDLELTKGTTLHGIVVRADGRTPVPSVSVLARASVDAKMGGRFTSHLLTSADGTFEMRVPPGCTLTVTARDSRNVAETDVVIPQDGEPEVVTLVFGELATIAGRVTAGGKPVEGLNVFASRRGTNESTQTSSTGRTDAEGRYELGDVMPGESQVSLRTTSASSRNVRMPEPKTVTVASGETATVDFELSWGEVIEGVVTDAAGAPIKGASLGLSVRESWGGYSTGTYKADSDADGYYAIRGLDDTVAMNAVSAYASGYFPDSKPVASFADSPVNFTLKANPGIPLAVYAGSPSAPVAEYEYVVVGVTPSGSMGYYPNNPMRVRAADGRTMLENIQRGLHRVEVREAGEGSAGRSAVAEFSVFADVPPVPIAIDLGAGVQVAGRVMTDKGAPVAGAELSLYPPNTMFDRGDAHRPSAFNATTDEAGRFSFPSVTPASYDVGVWRDRFLGRQAITVPSDRAMEPLEIVVSLAASIDVLVVVGGTTYYSQESGIAYEIVPLKKESAAAAGAPLRGVLSFNQNSRARVEDIPVGSMRITVTLPDGRTGSQDFEASPQNPDQSVIVDVRQGIEMTGVVRINGVPWDGKGRLTANPGDALEHLGNGAYRATVHAGSGCLVDPRFGGGNLQSYTVPAGVASFVQDFDIALAGASVVLTMPGNEALPGGSITLSLEKRTFSCAPGGNVQMSTKGSAFFESVVPGRYVASFRSGDELWTGTSGPGDVSVGGENTFVVDVRRSDRPVRLGTWDSSRMAEGRNALSFAVPPVPDGGMHYAYIVFEQTGGDGTMEFARATFRSRDATFSQTFAILVSPAARTAQFRFDREGICSGGGCTLEIDAIPHGEGGSRGVVHLIPR